MEEQQSYPLQWPVGRPRRPANQRQRAKFGATVERGESIKYRAKGELSIYAAIQRVKHQVELLHGSKLVISSNIRTRLDGLPLSRAATPDDPAVAVYFVWRSKTRAFPSDKWDRVADNIAAVAAHLDAIRRIERYAVGEVEQVFEGYKALPAMSAKSTWWAILGFSNPPPSLATVEVKYRERIRAEHPDVGGNANQAAEINAAFDEATRYYGRRGF